jgi:glycosyltransferase involved in cell wall biosynthesis
MEEHSMKILILSRYTRLGASSRLRLYQFLPVWADAGITCVIHPLLNDQYLHALYGKKAASKTNLIRGYAATLKQVLFAGRYDLVVIEKEVFPFLPPLAEWWLRLRNIPYVVDYDDAIFHNYDQNTNGLVRFVLGKKIASVMRWAAVVVCGNEYLCDYARRAGVRKIGRIPTVIDTQKYTPAPRDTETGVVVIGWMGSPMTAKYVKTLRPVLAALASRYGIRLHLVGAAEGIGLGASETVLPWSEAGEAALIGAFDIGIMPLEDSPWERGKCGYKLIQYMGCGLPVVGSPVGVNREIIREGINGFAPDTEAEWAKALETLILDKALRLRMGQAGRKMVLETYALQTAARQWINIFQHIIAVKNQPHVRDIRDHSLSD